MPLLREHKYLKNSLTSGWNSLLPNVIAARSTLLASKAWQRNGKLTEKGECSGEMEDRVFSCGADEISSRWGGGGGDRTSRLEIWTLITK